MRVFKPSEDNRILQSPCGRVISLKQDFFLATKDPMLSLKNSPVCYPPGPKYSVFQATRVKVPTMVEGVLCNTYIPDQEFSLYSNMDPKFDCTPHINSEKTLLPAGSLLLREFDKVDGVKGPWYGITPAQIRLQNLQRQPVIDVDPTKDTDGISISHGSRFSKNFIGNSFVSGPEQKAQLADIDDVTSINSVFGRLRSTMVALTLSR